MVLIIDNYDSFTYNLYQYISEIGVDDITVVRNDKISISKIEELSPDSLVISPGPGRPETAGITVKAIKAFSGKIPILGVCLGHQAIGYAFGARIIGAKNIVHGKTDEVSMDGKGLFRNIPSPAKFTRYHSLVVDTDRLPEQFEITATSSDDELMGIRHKDYLLEGIQFHPESIASEFGKKLLYNFFHYMREPFDFKKVLNKLINSQNLSRAEAEYFMEELTGGQLTNAQIAAILTGFNSKGITSEELAGLASILDRNKIKITYSGDLLDTCGTGGDGKGSFNISSLAAIVASSCGAKVAKHGNRSISSKSGSADFYRALGIPIDISPNFATKILSKTGFTFLFAPIYHKSMKYAAQVRRELGIKTVMNILGPLVNPADTIYQTIGVFDENLLEIIAKAAILLGKKHILTFHSEDGLDEISVCAPTNIVEMHDNGDINKYKIKPEDFGIKPYNLNEIKGGMAEENAGIAISILKGNSSKYNAIKTAVEVNTGASLYVSKIANTIKEGFEMAREAIEDKRALKKLEEIKEVGEILKK